jgi:membrane protease YdiL (CAAX protease family)
MKSNTTRVDYPRRAASLARETKQASSVEGVKVVPDKHRRSKLPSTLEGSAALGYADVGLFFVSVYFLAVIFRVGVHAHWLPRTALDNPNLSLQIVISLSLIGSLYAIVRFRHGRQVWTLLGWSWPRRIHLVAALVGGTGLGIVVDIIARATTPTTHLIHLWKLIVLDGLLGPVIEESFFRGCFLPIAARRTGPTLAILATSVLFATLHPVGTLLQWLCFLGTGTALGWMRIQSGSTAASALMHAIYNATLFLCQAL